MGGPGDSEAEGEGGGEGGRGRGVGAVASDSGTFQLEVERAGPFLGLPGCPPWVTVPSPSQQRPRPAGRRAAAPGVNPETMSRSQPSSS